jgi:hypothetical protein
MRCLWFGAVVAVAGCGDNRAAPTSDAGSERALVSLPAEVSNQLDLVVVVGNENSTLEIQLAFERAYPALAAQLSLGAVPDLHLATITPDLGTSAKLGDPAPAIPGTVGGCHDQGDAGLMWMGDPAVVFRRGSTGCGFQQPLAAIRAAFANPANSSFRRADAALGVILLADEDDCSALDPLLFTQDTTALGKRSTFRCTQFGITCAEPDMTTPGLRTHCAPDHASTLIEDPADFVDTVLAQAADRRRIAVGAVIGPGGPDDLAVELRAPPGSMTQQPARSHACEWQQGLSVAVADPAIRTQWFVQQFGDRGAIASICDDDLTAAATTMGINLRRAMGDPCVEDDVPLTDCTAVDEVANVETPLPPCASNETACYELVTDSITCPNAAHQKLVVHRATAPAPSTYTLLRCR